MSDRFFRWTGCNDEGRRCDGSTCWRETSRRRWRAVAFILACLALGSALIGFTNARDTHEAVKAMAAQLQACRTAKITAEAEGGR
jgi:hypothetical protein